MNAKNIFHGKKARYWFIGLVVVFSALFLVLRFNSARSGNARAGSTGTVVFVNAAQTIEVAGSLAAQPFAALTWNTRGVVEEVKVKSGDKVKAGDVLMKLKTTSTSSRVIAAQADLVNAQKNLDDLRASSNADQAQALIDLRAAKQAYDRAVNYLGFLEKSKTTPQTQARTFIESINRGGKRYVFHTKEFKGPAPEDWIVEAQNDLALKKAKLEDAQRAYDKLEDGPNAQDVTIAQARIDAAQATIDSLSILAPFDGEVLYVASQPNDVVTTQTTALHLANLDHLYIETQVDESDIASVKVGNPVTATLDAMPDVKLTGHVAAVDPLGEEVSGSVQYTIRIDLDQVTEDVSLPLGSTANATIQVKAAKLSLAAPITVIQNDSQGEYVLVVQADGSTKRVDVVSGAIVGDLVTVIGGLREGDTLTTSSGNGGMPGMGLRRMLR